MRRDIDIGLLRPFVAVVERPSVPCAASLLRLKQAALSRRRKRPEEPLGTAGFERPRGLLRRPTGEPIARAQRLIACTGAAWGAVRAAPVGGARLGVPHELAGPRLPPVLQRVGQAWPPVQVTLQCTTTTRLRALPPGARLQRTFNVNFHVFAASNRPRLQPLSPAA